MGWRAPRVSTTSSTNGIDRGAPTTPRKAEREQSAHRRLRQKMVSAWRDRAPSAPVGWAKTTWQQPRQAETRVLHPHRRNENALLLRAATAPMVGLEGPKSVGSRPAPGSGGNPTANRKRGADGSQTNHPYGQQARTKKLFSSRTNLTTTRRALRPLRTGNSA